MMVNSSYSLRVSGEILAEARLTCRMECETKDYYREARSKSNNNAALVDINATIYKCAIYQSSRPKTKACRPRP